MALVGAQWGSEGKGVVANHLAGFFDAAVRVGGPNAGHSLFHKGQLFKMRSVPCLWVNPETRLFIGAGAVVNAALLKEELASLPFRRTIMVDPTATIITHEHEHTEAETIRALIGSTAEGVGEARVARMRRNGSALLARDYDWQDDRVLIGDVSEELDRLLDGGALIMLEGTQGSGLSLFHGTKYPYSTSTDTNASGLASEAGIAPSDVGHVHLVARTYPIRVAGNSGPMGEELDWSWFVEEGLVDAPEQTTVTKKVRRVSRWYEPVVDKAVRLNQPCGIWLTFGDYLDVAVRGKTSVLSSERIMDFVTYIENRYAVPVLGVGTGPVIEDGKMVDWATARLTRRCAHGTSW